MARQTRSDCTVGAFEKRTACPRAQSETKTGEILAATAPSAQYAVKPRKKAKSGKALTAQSPSGSPRRPRYIGEADVPHKPPANCRGLD